MLREPKLSPIIHIHLYVYLAYICTYIQYTRAQLSSIHLLFLYVYVRFMVLKLTKHNIFSRVFDYLFIVLANHCYNSVVVYQGGRFILSLKRLFQLVIDKFLYEFVQSTLTKLSREDELGRVGALKSYYSHLKDKLNRNFKRSDLETLTRKDRGTGT